MSQMSAEELAAYDAATRELIDTAEQEVATSERIYESRKEAAASAKKELEADELQLRKLIRDRREQRGKKPQPTLLDHAGDPDNGTLEDLFKLFPIERWQQFGLTTKDIEKLASGEIKSGGTHPIITIGDLQNFVTPNPANPSFARGYGDLKGIGQAGIDRIAEAELRFWGWWDGGGEAEFAKEKGYGTAPVAGDGSEVSGDGDTDDTPIEAATGDDLALIGVGRGGEE